jgi:transposase-like protein
MARKGEKTQVGQDRSEVVRELPRACCGEQAATEFLERRRWGDQPACPKCGSDNVYQMTNKQTGERQANFRWRCRDCKKQYTVRTGTVMEDSRIPLHVWCWAFWSACRAKKGISALQIKRETGLSYKSALFLMHRIRFAMAPTSKGGDDGDKLTGTVEVDETYHGGKPRYRRSDNPRGTHGKQPILAMVQRGGQVRARQAPDVTAKTLRQAVNQHVDKAAHLMTDELGTYQTFGHEYASHSVVKHKTGEYVRGDVTTNTVEGFFSLLKRGIYGVYHNVSREHLQRYLDEFEFRFNHRDMDDGARTIAAIQGAEGKRLMYSQPVAD